MAFLVEEFNALPSQIDNEDAGAIARLRKARSIYNVMRKANAEPSTLTPDEDALISRVIQMRKQDG